MLSVESCEVYWRLNTKPIFEADEISDAEERPTAIIRF